MSKTKTSKKTKRPQSITKDVMSKIKSEEVKMKPKAYFVVGSVLLGAGITSTILLALLFLSISMFHIRTQNPMGFLRLGIVGGPAFLRIFPFGLTLVSILSISLGAWLLKKYDISYKKNFLGIIFAIVGSVIVMAFIIDKFGASDRLEKLRTLKPLYKQEFSKENVIMGEVISVHQDHIEIQKPTSETSIPVYWDENTIIPGDEKFQVGDRVGVVGKYYEGVIYAQGIHKGRMMWKKQIKPSSGSALPRPRVKGAHRPTPLRK
ncbi:hypothetical protein ACFL1M_01125 [Patescibacteria group bacterium]